MKAVVMLEDGTYDAFVIDAEADDEAVRLDLAILGGDHKGEVVSVRASGLTGEPLDLLGLPGTLVVADGEPRVTLDRS
ncbi:MAG: hypothetical protein ACRD0U_08600 [Acidimicrobiales bacterium]